MEPLYIVKDSQKLRLGYTTGSCAAAASKAAAEMLLTGRFVQQVRLTTPKGIELELEIEDGKFDKESASCGVRKDGGDDIDATHGMMIYAKVQKTSGGFSVDGGTGIGRVTKPGLACKVGDAAINPVPRRMILMALEETCARCRYTGGLHAVIFAPGGDEVAGRTFNPQLGITGGISILGTSGIVEPMSEQALIGTIHVELDSRYASSERDLLLSPGNYGQDFAKKQLHIDLSQSVKCSNFLGDTLDYAVYKGFERILLIGHAGKLIKVAAGVFQTHSSVADGRREVFASHAALCGGKQGLIGELMEAASADQCIALLKRDLLDKEVLRSISFQIEKQLHARLLRKGGKGCQIEFVVFTNQYGEIMRTKGAGRLLERFQIKGR